VHTFEGDARRAQEMTVGNKSHLNGQVNSLNQLKIDGNVQALI
jgi:hypothetical protein